MPFRDSDYMHEFPTHMVYLANFLEERLEHDVITGFLDMIAEWILDPSLDPFDDTVLERIVKETVDKAFSYRAGDAFIIAISCLTSFQYPGTRAVLLAINRLAVEGAIPRPTVVVGGYHASAVPDDFRDLGVDFIVAGEGELALRDIARIAGLHSPRDERVSTSLPRVVQGIPVANLDDLPPVNFSVYMPYLPHYPRLSLALSRGCPMSCAFCIEPAQNRPRWRAYSPRRALQELQAAVTASDEHLNGSQGGGFIGLYDPTFGHAPRWRDKIVDYLASNPTGYTFWAETRVDNLARTSLQRFKEARIRFIVGLESGSPATLLRMNKTNDPASYLDAITRVVGLANEIDYGPLALNVMFNFPGETCESIAETFTFLNHMVDHHGPFLTGQQMYYYFPGDAVHANLSWWEETSGTRVYNKSWWRDRHTAMHGEFLDASWSLSYSESLTLVHEGMNDLLKKCMDEVNAVPVKFEYARRIKIGDAKRAARLAWLNEIHVPAAHGRGQGVS